MRLVPTGSATSSTVTSYTDLDAGNLYVYPPMRVFPDLRALLWARELKLYLEWNRPTQENEETEYWNVLICDGCGGLREVASPCPRCDSSTYRPTYPGAAPKGPPTGFGAYKE